MQLDKFENAIPTVGYFANRSNTSTWHIEPTRIDFIDLTYVIGGQAVYTIDNQKILAEEGDLICVPKNSVRSAKSTNPAKFECFAANFQLNTIDGEDVAMPLPLVSRVGMQGDISSHYRKLGEDWLNRNPGYAMRVRAQFMLILQRLMTVLVYDTHAHHLDSRVKQAIRHITENYADTLTISAVAESVSLNPVYFGALFKKETNVTFRDYLNTVRLNRAEDMLRAGKLNVTEVAQICGFSDVFYFSRLFKKYKGVPPSAVHELRWGDL